MGQVGGYMAMAAGAGAILTALGQVLSALSSGHMPDQTVITTLVAGFAAFSPGLGKFKVDR